jgi:hypothetical protein
MQIEPQPRETSNIQHPTSNIQWKDGSAFVVRSCTLQVTDYWGIAQAKATCNFQPSTCNDAPKSSTLIAALPRQASVVK